MVEKSFFEEKGRALVGGLGLLLLLLSIGIGVWVVGIVDEALHRPHEIPLLQSLGSGGSSTSEVLVMDHEDSITARFPSEILLIVFMGLLLASLGSIVGAMVSSGARLLGLATGLLPREAEKKEQGN